MSRPQPPRTQAHRWVLRSIALVMILSVAVPGSRGAEPWTPEQLRRLEGNYTVAVYPKPFGFLVKNGVLHLKVGGLEAPGEATPLIAREDGKFVVSPGHPNAFQFTFEGTIVRFRLWSAGQSFEGARVGEPAASPAAKRFPTNDPRTRRDLLAALPEAEARAQRPDASAADRLNFAKLLFEAGDFPRASERVAPLVAEPTAEDAAVELAARLDFLSGRFEAAEQGFNRLYQLRAAEPARAVQALVGKLFTYYQQDRFDAIAALPFPQGAVLPLLTMARDFPRPPYRIEWHGERREAVVPLLAVDPLPVFALTVDGTPINVLFDTGADQLILDDGVAKALGVRVVDSATGTFAGGLTAQVGFGRVGSVRLGDVSLHDVPVQILPAERFTFDPHHKVGGIVGTSLMRHFLGTLDYAGARLVLRERSPESSAALRRARPDAVSVPFVLDATHLMFAPGGLHGQSGMTLFVDSGLASEAALVLPEQTLEVLGIAKPETRLTQADVGGGHGAFAEGFVELRSATLGTLEQQQLKAEVGALTADSYWSRGFIQDGLISHRFLRRYASWTIDFTNRVMLFDR